MQNIGIVFGCFIPLHRGHAQLIEKARRENHDLILAVCGYDDDRGIDFIPFSTRKQLIQNIYSNDNSIHIISINDKDIGLTGQFDLPSWKTWSNALFTNAGYDPNDKQIKYTWYTGDKTYVKNLQQIFPTHVFKLLDRTSIDISGSMIRSNINKYKSYIHPVFATYLDTYKPTAEINKFDGDNYFLSNFYPCTVTYNGITFDNSEAAYQAQKDLTRLPEFIHLKAGDAKKLGATVTLRNDWDDIKLQIMYDIVLNKFSQNHNLAEKLIATGNTKLVEGNYWNDKFWGICNGAGQNHLGKILMKVRDELSISSNNTNN